MKGGLCHVELNVVKTVACCIIYTSGGLVGCGACEMLNLGKTLADDGVDVQVNRDMPVQLD